MTADNAATILLRRVRDPAAIGTSLTQARRAVSEAQRLVNAGARLVFESVPLTLTPRRNVYSMSTVAPSAIRIEAVRHDDETLDRVELEQLIGYDRQWFRRLGDRPEVWAPIGRELFVVYPGRENDEVTLDVVYTKLNADVTSSGSTELDVKDEDVPVVLALAEILLYVRMHLTDNLQGIVNQYGPMMQRVGRRGVA